MTRARLPAWGEEFQPGYGHTGAMLLLISTLSQVLAVAISVLVATRLAFLIVEPRQKDLDRATWPERARLTWPARTGGVLTLMVMTMIGIIAPILSGPVRLPRPWLEILCVGTGWAIARSLRIRQERRLSPDPAAFDPKQFRRGRRAWLVVMYSQSLVVLVLTGIGFGAPARPFLAVALPLTVAVVWFGVRGGGLDLGRRLGLVSDAPDWLKELAQERGAVALVEVRGVDVIEWEYANAVAFSLAGRLGVTRGALEVLDRSQLSAVLDHEVGHLGEPPSVKLKRRARLVTVLPFVALGPLVDSFGLAGLFAALGGVLVISAATKRLGRRMEERADEQAHEHGEDPAVYAHALEAIYRANHAPAVLGTGVHPSLDDRMKAAGVTPEWPRPLPPSRWRPRLGAGAALLLASFGLLGMRAVVWIAVAVLPPSPIVAAVWGGADWVHLDLADAGRCDDAWAVAEAGRQEPGELEAICPR